MFVCKLTAGIQFPSEFHEVAVPGVYCLQFRRLQIMHFSPMGTAPKFSKDGLYGCEVFLVIAVMKLVAADGAGITPEKRTQPDFVRFYITHLDGKDYVNIIFLYGL